MSYRTEYDHSMKDPAGFWRKQAEALEWFKFPQQILSLDKDGRREDAQKARDRFLELKGG